MTPARSDHFNGKRFFNPGGSPEKGLLDVLRWRMTSRAVPWREGVAGEPQPATLPPLPVGAGITATWVGHSTFLVRSASANLLTDPFFSERASPVSWAGPRRVVAPGIPFDMLPPVQVVLLSHDHYDHCDLPSLRRLAARDNPIVIAPLGHRGLLSAAGFGRIVELDWWGSHPPLPGLEVTLVPALHWCRRMPYSTNTRLWGGFVARLGGRQVYFVGDSGYAEGLFAEIGERMGAPDLALIPIGAYEPRWFMAQAHMNPAEAVQVHRAVGSRRSIGMHWGTIQLTDESWDAPVRALGEARGPGDAFDTLGFGASISV
jgi:L-ascorbate metabolism protein UlaG (beta-lactamase superfamily)